MEKTDILSLTFEELSAAVLEMGEKKFRAKQIYDWLHDKKAEDFEQMSNLSAQLRADLSERFFINRLTIKRKLVSKIDGTTKYLYGLMDGEAVESVLMDYKHGAALCVSTQVGCKMGCKFCASTLAGWVRNLSPSEMLSQMYESERDSGKTLDSIVLMGIGEPLDNFANVMKFLRILEESGFSLRRVSLSTCGVVDKIYELAKLKLGVTLSVSLHAATDEKRSEIMPINNRFHLKELMRACDDYFAATGRRISFEYSLIEGVNDDETSAKELITLLGGKNCHINLIPINEVRERGFKKSPFVERFQRYLTSAGLNATVRRTLGADIEAACGQLRRDNQ